MTIVDLIGQLPVHPTKRYGTRGLAQIQYLVVHHAAGPETQTVEQIARFHVQTRDWPGIAYQALIDPAGIMYKTWPASTITYCVGGANTKSLCVCLIGNRETTPCPLPQWGALVELLRAWRDAYPTARAIYGHREVPTTPPQATVCPGKHINLDRLRAAVNALDT